MSQHQVLSLEDIDSRVIFSNCFTISQISHSMQNRDYLSPIVFPRRTGPLVNEVSTGNNGRGWPMRVVSYERSDVLPLFPILFPLLVLLQTLLLLCQIFMLVYHDHDRAMNTGRWSGYKTKVPEENEVCRR